MVRLGILIPSSNTTMEYEFNAMVPKPSTVHTGRMHLVYNTIESLAAMEEEAPREASKLATAEVDVIGFGCTTGSLVKGFGYDKHLEGLIQKASGKATVVTAGAVVKALKALGIEKVAIATPYTDDLNTLEERFLRDNCLTIIDLQGLRIRKNTDIGKLGPEVSYELAKKLDHKDADGVFISCTNFRTIEYIEKLEQELGKPVFSSNTATLWAMLKLCPNSIQIKGFGSLFKI